jgi:hypothetical protein
MLASPELISRRDMSDEAINREKLSRWLSADLRKLGYELALREARGDRSEDFKERDSEHFDKLHELYRVNKV